MTVICKVTESAMKSLPKVHGRFYFCQDSKNLYVDTNYGRIAQPYEFINTELERLALTTFDKQFYYIYETGELWMSNSKSMTLYAKPNPNSAYPAQYSNESHGSYNVAADSFNLLVQRDVNSIGSLRINPLSSNPVYDEDTGRIERIVTAPELGKMIYNGDIYYTRYGREIRISTDDGCLDDLDPPVGGD